MELPKKSEQADELAAALGRKHETQLASFFVRSAISSGSPKASSADLGLSRLSGSIVKKTACQGKTFAVAIDHSSR